MTNRYTSALRMCRAALEVEMRSRRSGRTTITAEAAKTHGAALVCIDRRDAERIQHEHGADSALTITLEQVDSGRLAGLRGPVLYDPSAVARLANGCDLAIRGLLDDVMRAKRAQSYAEGQADTLRRKVREANRENRALRAILIELRGGEE